MQPGAEARLAGKGMELLPDPDEDILHRIVRLSRIEQPGGETVYPANVAPVQSLEGSMIACHGEGDVGAIGIGVIHVQSGQSGRQCLQGSILRTGRLVLWSRGG